MQQELKTYRQHLTLLELFERKYGVGQRQCSLGALVHGIGDEGPSVTFYERDREWITATFGTTDWIADGVTLGYQNVAKVVDGVKVVFYKAFKTHQEPRAVFSLPLARHQSPQVSQTQIL